MTRDEMLESLWNTAALLDDKQLREATAMLEEIAFRGRATTQQRQAGENSKPKSYDDFVAELSATLRTGEDAA